ncbi:hypothetical protein KUCAC02_022311 [Chaenocephalus aceratus]|uniref:Uncharacterized protein n=1 Tax=Chaenocephalus aceratus TaxID=36190 RepID=A0ACB9XMZ3_CHAAC|nr:hypothetical protein KUCAC02_022311 [Chaenocephalus aceratus]
MFSFVTSTFFLTTDVTFAILPTVCCTALQTGFVALVQHIIYLRNKIHSGPVCGGNGATRKRNRRRRKRRNSGRCFGNRLGFGPWMYRFG